MTAYGYIRVSRMDEDQPKQSPLVQEERIRALAAARGHADIVFAPPDLNVSGGKAMDERPGFRLIVEAIEAGDCTAVYAYDLSRLFRNLKEQIAFLELAQERRVPVRFVEGSITEVAGPTGKMLLSVVGAMNEWQREITSEKIRASLERIERDTGKRNGNVPYGQRPGEDPRAVLAAFEEAQSYDGAARLLNERGIRSRGTNRRTSVWHGSTVRGVLRRLDPDRFGEDRVRDRRSRGVRAGAGEFRLSRLLVCGACGTVMTPSVDSRTREVRYYCRNARVDKRAHGRGWVSEKLLLPAVAAEADRAWAIASRLDTIGSADDEARAAALDAKRARILDMVADGMLDKGEARGRLDEVDEARSGLRTRRLVRRVTVPPEIADGPERRVNEYLRRLLSAVTVESMADRARRGPSREPIRLSFDWREAAA